MFSVILDTFEKREQQQNEEYQWQFYREINF